MILKPSDPYSPEWLDYWKSNPHLRRGVGADAAGEGGEGGEGSGEGGGEGSDAAPAWVEGVKDEGLKGALSKLESQDKLFEAIGYKPPKPEAVDWRSDLPDDLKKTAERFTSKEDTIRAIQAFQKREGQIRVPGKDATDEEKAAYRKAVGIPEKPEDYEFPEVEEVTDEIKASRQAWSKRFHELGVSKDTAKALTQMVNEDVQKFMQSQVEGDKEFAKQQEEALRGEWKAEFDKNKTLANRAFKEISERAGIKLENLTKIETKDGRFLMDRAEMLKLFSVIGKEMSEGTLGPVLSDGEAETVEGEIRDLRKQISEAQGSGDSKRANQLYQREQALIAKIKGNKPIVGSQGRAA